MLKKCWFYSKTNSGPPDRGYRATDSGSDVTILGLEELLGTLTARELFREIGSRIDICNVGAARREAFYSVSKGGATSGRFRRCVVVIT